ncbi:putative small nuclear ribonucleoprotein G [Glycine max]|nr:putative small nuclear ribonucleoprotein G [Glycine max]
MVVGTLCGFDQFMNLVIDNPVEVNGNEKNDIGMVDSNGAIDQEELKKCTFNGVLMANRYVYGFSTVFIHLGRFSHIVTKGAHNFQRLPNCVITHLNAYGQHMTILRKFGPPLHWNVVVLDIGIGHRYVVQPWYQFLADSDFYHDDEVSFYYRRRDKI